MGDTAVGQDGGSYVRGLGRGALITTAAVMVNSLVLVVFMWYMTFELLRAGDPVLVNIIASTVRSLTLAFHTWGLHKFFKRGYSVRSVDEVVKSFGTLELINSAALLAFYVGTLASFEELGVPADLGSALIYVKLGVLIIFAAGFVIYMRKKPTQRDYETIRKQVRDLVTLAMIDSTTVAIFMWLTLLSLNENGDSRTASLGIFAILHTLTLMEIFLLVLLNRPKRQKPTSG